MDLAGVFEDLLISAGIIKKKQTDEEKRRDRISKSNEAAKKLAIETGDLGLYRGISANQGIEAVENEARARKQAEEKRMKEMSDHPEASQYWEASAAQGGIFSGPKSGFSAVLHGTEAVIPLDNNRQVPVNLDLSDAVNAISSQTALLEMANSKLDDLVDLFGENIRVGNKMLDSL